MIDLAYLPLLVEEAGEIIQAAMKLQRFGEEHRYRTGSHKGLTNLEALTSEVGDFLEVLDRLGLNQGWIEVGRQHKRERLRLYDPHIWYPGIEDAVSNEPAENEE